MSKQRMVIWEIQNDLEFEEILELLKLNYKIEIPYLKKYEISENEKFLSNAWESFYSTEEIKIEFLEHYNIQYISARGYVEEKKMSEKFTTFNEKEVLAKENRVRKFYVDSVFFELEMRKFVVLFIKTSYESIFRSSLLGCSKSSKPEHKKWGKINFSNPSIFQLTDDFFYWLLSKNNQEIKISSGIILITDINGIGQKDNESMTEHSNYGDNIMDSTITQAGIGASVDIKEISITFQDENSRIKLLIKNNSETQIYMDNAHFFINGSQISFIENNLKMLVFKVYIKLIWELKKVYSEEKNLNKWTTEDKEKICKQSALSAIKELLKNNNIDPKLLASL